MIEWFLYLALLFPNGAEKHIRMTVDAKSSLTECNEQKLDPELFRAANEYARISGAQFQLRCVGIPSSKYEI